MKLLSLIIGLISLTTFGIAQEKGDYIWMFGEKNLSTNPLYGGCTVDFNFAPPDVYSEERDFYFDMANTSMCDDEGNLLFYSNGRVVFDKNHNLMFNGDNLNLDYLVGSTNAIRLWQGVMTLQDPNDSLQYFIFHMGEDVVNFPSGLAIISYPFFYSKVNLAISTFPNGIVTNKNTQISQDTFDNGKITATRHANGRDWWIVLSEYNTNNFHRFLLSPNGVEDVGKQEVGVNPHPGLGQAVFSPDGSKYAHLSLDEFEENYLNIYDFDRCTGLLSNHQQLFFTDNVGAGGVAISPSSQYLYVMTSVQIRQFDLWADDIFATEDTVAIYDGSFEVIPLSDTDTAFIANTFFLGQIAPDDKIYVCASNSVSSLTVINQPDLAGEACEVLQHGFDLPSLNIFSMPNFPNYRLGALEGSPCDTLNLTDTKEEVLQKRKIKLFPNPTTGAITIDGLSFLKEDGALVLYNQLGQAVATFSLAKGQEVHSFILENVADGIYFYSVFQKGEKIDEGKLVVH